MTHRPDNGGAGRSPRAASAEPEDTHQRSITLDECGCGWARVVVVLPAELDAGLTLLAAAEALGGAVLASCVEGETMPVVGFGASASAVQARPPTRHGLDSFGSLN